MRPHESERVIPFAPAPKHTAQADADQLDRAGQTILQLLHKAAGVADWEPIERMQED
jgi:hypothetical protein